MENMGDLGCTINSLAVFVDLTNPSLHLFLIPAAAARLTVFPVVITAFGYT